MIYKSFLDHLETCGGCIDLRDQNKCQYALVCSHVEGMAKRREIRNSQDLIHRGVLLSMDMKKAPAPTEAQKKITQVDYTTRSGACSY